MAVSPLVSMGSTGLGPLGTNLYTSPLQMEANAKQKLLSAALQLPLSTPSREPPARPGLVSANLV